MLSCRYVVSAFLIVFGAMLATVDIFGSSIPYTDEWDAEANWLYRLFEQGDLGFGEIAAPHFGHRLILTRLTSLGLYVLNGGWDPQLQMIVNGLLHALICAVLVGFIVQRTDGPYRTPAAVATIILFTVPFSWLSILVAFQTQFYFMLLFSILALKHLSSSRYLAGYSFAALAMLSMTPGALLLPAYIFTLIVSTLRHRYISREQLGQIAICSAVFIFFVWHLPETTADDAYHAGNLYDFFVTVFYALYWPIRLEHWVGLIIYAPFVLLLIKALRHSGVPIFLLALGGFITLQILAMGYFRGGLNIPIPNRYWEILIVGIWLNGMSLFFIMRNSLSRPVKAFAFAWMFVAIVGLSATAFESFSEGLPGRKAESLTTQSLITEYLETGNREVFAGFSIYEVSYPDTERLIDILNQPVVRDLLPGSLGGSSADNLAGVRNVLFRLHWLMILGGLCLLALPSRALRGF